MSPLLLIALVLIGFLAGVLSGLFGVGGAVVTTPALRAVGVSPILAVGSTIPAILPASIAGALRYHRDGLVDARVGFICGATGSAFAVLGAIVSDVVDARWLMVATAVLLGWSGVSSIRRARRREATVVELRHHDSAGSTVTASHISVATTAVANRTVANRTVTAGTASSDATAGTSGVALTAVGAAAGFLAGLLGIGGGIIMVPLFTGVLRLPVKVATGSSLVAVSVFSATALVSHTLLGHVDWPSALALVVGTVPGARVGAATAIGASDRTMRIALGMFFLTIAVVFAGTEISALLS